MADKRGQISNLGSQLDAQLMAAPSRRDDSVDKAGDLRAAKRQDSQGDNSAPGAPMPGGQPTSLREAVLQEKKQKANKEKEEGSSGGKAASPARKGISALLRQAWINLIPSYGLTLIWINIHIFLGMIFGNNLFCKLGVEWTDKATGAAMAKGSAMQKKLESKAGSSIGLAEKMGVGCADLGCLFILISIAAIIALLVKVISNPIDFYAQAIGWMWNSAVEAIVKFISGS